MLGLFPAPIARASRAAALAAVDHSPPAWPQVAVRSDPHRRPRSHGCTIERWSISDYAGNSFPRLTRSGGLREGCSRTSGRDRASGQARMSCRRAADPWGDESLRRSADRGGSHPAGFREARQVPVDVDVAEVHEAMDDTPLRRTQRETSGRVPGTLGIKPSSSRRVPVPRHPARCRLDRADRRAANRPAVSLEAGRAPAAAGLPQGVSGHRRPTRPGPAAGRGRPEQPPRSPPSPSTCSRERGDHSDPHADTGDRQPGDDQETITPSGRLRLLSGPRQSAFQPTARPGSTHDDAKPAMPSEVRSRPNLRDPARGRPAPSHAREWAVHLPAEARGRGMGVVFEAYDEERGELVALKTMRRVDPAALVRFKQEFRALSDLTHPNLVNLYQLFAVENRWFFTMELVDGCDFLTYVEAAWTAVEPETDDAGQAEQAAAARTRPRRRPAPLGLTSRLRAALTQLAEGVHALHGAGKLHRDLKPTNVLVTAEGPGRPARLRPDRRPGTDRSASDGGPADRRHHGAHVTRAGPRAARLGRQRLVQHRRDPLPGPDRTAPLRGHVRRGGAPEADRCAHRPPTCWSRAFPRTWSSSAWSCSTATPDGRAGRRDHPRAVAGPFRVDGRGLA